ncbi:MAG TPA: alkaline phosphatase family protein [Roseiflexaceae bacterium]|nr:alkaline phosphatase family protein [Roseiflexaceae bacterium]
MVVLVMTDGVRPDALDPSRCPVHAALRARGAFTASARSVMPSVTLPCHMSIFHSVPPSRHGITTNLYVPMARPLPGLVEALRLAGKRCAFVHNWEPLRDLSRPEMLSYAYFCEPPAGPDVAHPAYDDDVAEQGARAIASGVFDFVFVYLGGVDAAGHAYGWMSEGYLAQLEQLDAALGRVVAALPRGAAIIVQSDHGGHERHHGTEAPEDMTIPWLVAGPGIRQGHTIVAPMSLLDTAPTVARLLGVPAPPEWEGRVSEEIFA